jgi:predicted DNA-binding protein
MIDTLNVVNNRNERTSTGPIRAAVEKEIQIMENHTN